MVPGSNCFGNRNKMDPSSVMRRCRWMLAMLLGCGAVSPGIAAAPADSGSGKPTHQFIRISDDGRHFVHGSSNVEFVPWGFNYDHDAANRLLETYWNEEWASVVGDFTEMKQLGANIVRIHLQVSRFMTSPTKINRDSIRQLARLLALAEKTGLRLDVTGLGCYDKADVPAWYVRLDEKGRWAVQARFWEAVATTCRKSPAVFCYDLMNEPVVSGDQKDRDWTPGAFGDRYFVQRLTLDPAGRSAAVIAEAWVKQMLRAIRKHDRRHLVTVGAIPWALTWPGARPLFYSKEVGRHLDFVSLHLYPKRGEVERALTALTVYDIGKPIVIEEIFPLNCPVADLDRFIDGSKPLAVGWLGFYWGKAIADYERDKGNIGAAMTREWLEYFIRKTPTILGPSYAHPSE